MPATKIREVAEDTEVVEDDCASCQTGKCGCKKCKSKRSRGEKRLGVADKNDALTPQEYLAACDLGIQGRNRSYIRARLDAKTKSGRPGKKCGNTYIPATSQCNLGRGPANKKGQKKTYWGKSKDPASLRRGLMVGARIGAGVGGAIGAQRAVLQGEGGFGIISGAVGGMLKGIHAGGTVGLGVQAVRKTRRAYQRSQETNRGIQAGLKEMHGRHKRQTKAQFKKGASWSELYKGGMKRAKESSEFVGNSETKIWSASNQFANQSQFNRGKTKKRPRVVWADGFEQELA